MSPPTLAGVIDVPPLDLAAVVAATGRDKSTVSRWIRFGVAVPGGRRVKLKATKVGAYWRLDPAAVREFMDIVTAASIDEPAPVVSPAARRRAGEAAGRALEKLGL